MKPTLYLLIGYPGSGKTTVSKLIEEHTGAVHLWADHIRNEMFPNPTHSKEESLQLYAHINKVAQQTLHEGISVIFDTNFNYLKDRQYMRQIATREGAQTVTIWITTPKEVAKKRAVNIDPDSLHRVFGSMPEEAFEGISSKLEPPTEDEKVIKIDGTDLDEQAALRQLGLI